MKKTALLVTLIILLLVLASCSSGGNDVSRAYDKALNEMKQENYQAAVETLADIPFYLDSTDLSLYCRAYQKAVELLVSSAYLGMIESGHAVQITEKDIRNAAEMCSHNRRKMSIGFNA